MIQFHVKKKHRYQTSDSIFFRLWFFFLESSFGTLAFLPSQSIHTHYLRHGLSQFFFLFVQCGETFTLSSSVCDLTTH